MSPRNQPGEGDSEAIRDSIERLADELRVLRDVLGELRTDLQWAIQNDRVIIIPLHDSTQKAAADVPADGKSKTPPGKLL